MHGGMMASNVLVSGWADYLRGILNTGHYLALYTNNLTITPPLSLASFSEATYAGYGPIPLAGLFTAPIKLTDGVYQMSAPTFNFSSSPGASPQTLYGFFIKSSSDWKLAQAFPTPFVMNPSGSLTMSISPQAWALALA